MAKRPEGLSPNFDSIVSPQIPSSFIFSWSYIKQNTKDFQKNAEVKVYAEGSTTALITLATGADQQADLLSMQSRLVLDESYEWEVKVTAADSTIAYSGKKPFQYVNVLGQGELAWPELPEPYEYIGTRKYFEEIRENALSVLEDYVYDSAEEKAMQARLLKLFGGDIVPSRKDFDIIEEALHLIAKKESTFKDEVVRLIHDGLGAEDIRKIYDIFNRMVRIPPKPPSNVYLAFEDLTPLIIQTGSVRNSGVGDLSIDVKWSPTELDTGTCVVNFLKDLSEDVSYYRIELEVGFTEFRAEHRLYYRTEDVQNAGRQISIPMDHIDFEHLSTTKKTSYVLNAYAVDKRGMESSPHSKLSSVNNVPLGVQKYQLRAMKKDLANKAVIKDYYDVYNGPAKAYVHNVTGNVDGFYHYAVRLYDKNGSVSPFYYIDSTVKVDPLSPPGDPKPTVKSTTTSTIEFGWPSVKDADKYEIDPQFGSAANTSTTGLTFKLSGLNEKTTYTVKIRATNRAGSSKWIAISGKTKTKPIVEHVQKGPKCRTWRTSYKVLFQNGNVSYPSGGYLPEKDNVEAMHGEWIELRDKFESGSYVKKGTRWGNHKTVFFLNASDWQAKLAGKEIVEVKFFIRRRSTQHGYPDDGRFLNIYTHNYAGASSLPPASKGPVISDHYKVEKLDFDRGQGLWITLPKSYGEKLRDGKIKGIAFHHPASTRTPYSYMRFDATTFDFRVKYK